MTSATTFRGLQPVDTQTQAFLDRPNESLGTGPDRVRVGIGRQGPEFFRYAMVREMFRERRLTPRTPQVFLDMGLTGGPILDYLVDGNLNLTWPEIHDRLRPILMKGFRPKRIEAFRPVIRDLAEELVDELLRKDHCNVVTEFTHHLSIRSIAAFIGVPPEDTADFDRATVDLRLLGQIPFWPGVPRLEKALLTVYRYTEGLVEKRRAMRADDFISDLVTAQEEGDRLSESELIWNVAGILLAGHDTTRYQLASCVRAILEAGAWEQLAADPSLLPVAVNEGMRIYPATPRQPKVTTEAMEWEGVEVPAGAVCTLNLAGAGRDPESFPNPDRLDLHRPEPAYDLGFGYGAHYCLGWAVAHAEMVEGLALLTQRTTDVALDGEVEVSPTGVIAGPEVVAVRYRKRG